MGKGASPAGVAGWFDSIGLRPGSFWAWVAIGAEAGGGLLTVLGFGGPIGPGLLAGDLIVDRMLGLTYPDWLLPAWLALIAAGALLALGIRSLQAPKTAQS